MRYTLLLHYPELTEADLGAEGIAHGQRAFAAYAQALDAAGILLSAEVLRPSESTTTLRTVDGAVQVQDGPYADTKDLLGGYVVIDVPSLDEALKWAARSPSSLYGSTGVMSVMTSSLQK
jgi:hypothetical protein